MTSRRKRNAALSPAARRCHRQAGGSSLNRPACPDHRCKRFRVGCDPVPDPTARINRMSNATAHSSGRSVRSFARGDAAPRRARLPSALGLLIERIAYLRIPDFSDQQIYPTLYTLNSYDATYSDFGGFMRKRSGLAAALAAGVVTAALNVVPALSYEEGAVSGGGSIEGKVVFK